MHARHILFQVTPAVRIPEIRARAEQTLNGLLREPDRFAAVAREMSNCPSGQQGGNLGQIGRGDTVPEFEKALFRLGTDRLVAGTGQDPSRVPHRGDRPAHSGKTLPFDVVHRQIADRLRSHVSEKALRQYVSVLAGQAKIDGVDLAGSASPLVQ